MKKGTKIFLGVGCGVLVLGTIAVVVGILALNYLEGRLEAGTQQSTDEGRRFGASTDQQGCVTEGMRRSKSAGVIDLSPALQNGAFVDACLEVSRPTPDFCAGVPSFWSMKDSEWGAAECRKAGIDPEKTGCIHVAKRKHQFCSKPFQ